MFATPEDAFKAFRADIRQKLGNEAIRDLHQQRPWIDWTVFIGLTALLFLLMYALYALPLGLGWIACFIAQGYVMQSIGFFSHDAFIHRHLGKKFGYYCNLFCMIPYFRLPTKYHPTHALHHRYLNTPQDPEFKLFLSEVKQNRLSKIVWFSPLGVYRFMIEAIGVNVDIPRKYIAALKREKYILCLFVLSMVLLTVLFPVFFINGYWLPLLTILPFISMWRALVLDHGEFDSNNPIQAITNYRSGIIFKLTHGFNSGDCHLIHHLYPNIPFYNIPKAITLFRPNLARYHVYEHTSYLSIIYLFLIKNKKRFSCWK